MKLTALIVVVAVALLVGGVFLFFTNNSVPGLAELRANPEKFSFDDYRSKEALHTRLSTLFPRGTEKQGIDDFFAFSQHKAGGEVRGECTLTYMYGVSRFIFGSDDIRLKGIQVRDGEDAFWPNYTDICPRKQDEPLTPAPGQRADPIHLPILPLTTQE